MIRFHSIKRKNQPNKRGGANVSLLLLTLLSALLLVSCAVTPPETEAETEPEIIVFQSNGDGTCYVQYVADQTIKGIVIPSVSPSGDTVTAIGWSAFADCFDLASVSIPDTVTSIGDTAFINCRELKNVVVPSGVTEIGGGCFYGCTSLESITLPFVGASKDGTEYTHFGHIFQLESSYMEQSNFVPQCLETVVITGGTSIGDLAFYACEYITNVTLPDSVTSIGSNAFGGCIGLKSIDLGDGLTSIGSHAFNACWALERVIIPEGVNNIEMFTFSGCTSLTSVTLENPDGWNAGGTGLMGLDDPSTAATYLKDTYSTCAWTRS